MVKTPAAQSAGRRFHLVAVCPGTGSVTPVEVDAALNFADGVVGQPDGPVAMATLVVVGFFQFHLGQTQMFDRRLHVRLIGAGAR